MKLTAYEFNDALTTSASNMILLAGRGIFIKPTDRSQLVECSADTGRHRHPWFVTVRWFGPSVADPKGAWKYLVNPGFVNGVDPLVPGSAPEPTEDDPEPKDLGLADADWIKVNATRALGEEGDFVPAFFKTLVEAPAGKAPRVLQACDIYASVARAQLVSDLQVTDPTGTSGTVLQYSPRFETSRLDQVGARARLMQAPKMPETKPASFVDRLLGVSMDESEDRMKIATLYFLQPSGGQPPELDGTWMTFTKQHVFWNLAHAAKNDPPKIIPPRQTFFTGLLGGLGDLIVNQYLALQQTLEDAASRVIARDEVGGKFWTA